MLDRVAELNRTCYKEKLQVISTFSMIQALLEHAPKPPLRLFCANEKEYLGSMKIYVMRLLTLIKDDKRLFALFLSALQTSKGVTEEYMEMLAADLVYMFFSDFTSNERSILNILRQFEQLIQVRDQRSEGRICSWTTGQAATRSLTSHSSSTDSSTPTSDALKIASTCTSCSGRSWTDCTT